MMFAIGKNIDQAAASLTMTSCVLPLTAMICPPDLQLDL